VGVDPRAVGPTEALCSRLCGAVHDPGAQAAVTGADIGAAGNHGLVWPGCCCWELHCEQQACCSEKHRNVISLRH